MATMAEPLKVLFPHDTDTWPKVKEVLLQLTVPTDDVEVLLGILHALYSAKLGKETALPPSKTPFHKLSGFLQSGISLDERKEYLGHTFPSIARRVLDLERLVPDEGLDYSVQQTASCVQLQREFVAALLAAGFLCLLPHPGYPEAYRVPESNFLQFFSCLRLQAQQAKLRCVLHYFTRLATKEDDDFKGKVTFRRVVLSDDALVTFSGLMACEHPLCHFETEHDEKIEDAGSKVLQVDFANEYLGGGVLQAGRVQEEIRFSICPELLSGMLFMECMAANEAIVMEGFEQFAQYSGYADSLAYAGDFADDSPRDNEGNILTSLVAIDAVPYGFGVGAQSQFSEEHLLRDINKAYAGFLQPYLQKWDEESLEAAIGEREPGDWLFQLQADGCMRVVATGNWGCGAFGGNPQLKALLQWLVASYARCPGLVYYTFGNTDMTQLDDVVSLVVGQKWTVGKLAERLLEVCQQVRKMDERRQVKEWSVFGLLQKM